MNARNTILTGSTFGLLGVAIGAFGAHALKPMLIESGRLETFELAVRYQFYHTFALLATGILMNQLPIQFLKFASWFFTGGILFFSGSLYLLCFSGLGVLGAITPIGGLLFIAGWICIFMSALKK
ncbi:MAG TPA: DUF423 domain-containing protein [Chryseolinea sp.]|nr:DUF423 domain-containing protein [Flavobacteriales bacterium]HPH46140.1 DUF423 domain-containing protein [Chryseolinea sp.]HPM31796.1 DUF423 domain-containing protein [Chryseolinea sp.]